MADVSPTRRTSMPPRIRLLFSTLNLALFLVAAVPLYGELSRRSDIWWTPHAMLVPLAESQDRVEVYVHGKPLAALLQAGQLRTSEGGSPWIVKARETLIRTKSKNEIIYNLDLGGQSYTWRFITNLQGSTTIVGPGFLSQSDAGPRAQQLYVTGEIHEYAGATILSLAVGSRRPTRDPKRCSNPTWPPK